MKKYFRDYITMKLYRIGKTEESDYKEKTNLKEVRDDNSGTKRQAAGPAYPVPAQPECRRCEMFDMPFVNTVATGQNINRMRIAAGMSVKDMQMVFGFTTPQAIYKWIHGTAMPTIDNLVILAKMFGVTMDDIVAVDMIDWKR